MEWRLRCVCCLFLQLQARWCAEWTASLLAVVQRADVGPFRETRRRQRAQRAVNDAARRLQGLQVGLSGRRLISWAAKLSPTNAALVSELSCVAWAARSPPNATTCMTCMTRRPRETP